MITLFLFFSFSDQGFFFLSLSASTLLTLLLACWIVHSGTGSKGQPSRVRFGRHLTSHLTCHFPLPCSERKKKTCPGSEAWETAGVACACAWQGTAEEIMQLIYVAPGNRSQLHHCCCYWCYRDIPGLCFPHHAEQWLSLVLSEWLLSNTEGVCVCVLEE